MEDIVPVAVKTKKFSSDQYSPHAQQAQLSPRATPTATARRSSLHYMHTASSALIVQAKVPMKYKRSRRRR